MKGISEKKIKKKKILAHIFSKNVKKCYKDLPRFFSKEISEGNLKKMSEEFPKELQKKLSKVITEEVFKKFA